MQQDDAYPANADANVRIDLIARIEASFSQQTPSGKRIAGWLLNNLAQIPFESADSIAGYTGTTGITVGRYLRKLGYRNLEDVKASLRADALAPYRPWGVTDRLDAWQQQRTLSDRLSPSLRLEVDAIQDVYRLAQTEAFARISQQLAEAEAVFILGIQSTRGIANAFFSHLEYLRPRVSYVDGLSGTWVESLNSEYRRPYVVVTDTRAYSTVARQYCRAANDRQIPLALITDLWCPWARDYPMDLLQVKTDTGHFWDSLAPITCLFNLLLSAVVEQLGDKLSARLALNRALQTEFGQFEQ
ncbi:MurR/RpiR family transcriptional regulator [Symbiopectobacterium purcellii]|uniref:MurR/RpiR family transcriptional regulator n=1 Tax=Symbiopectobacterium purcellii TaxID=2871826 RepID=A0ABX9AG02_9ENTR|nr:MurR/RpiR family transcriptional regulator [Symbiopectobacterium purcellii]QZN94075.1 MurR/RpiR family transcriptional regulator [Symbiopectobacterium purcellii]